MRQKIKIIVGGGKRDSDVVVVVVVVTIVVFRWDGSVGFHHFYRSREPAVSNRLAGVVVVAAADDVLRRSIAAPRIASRL